MFASACSRSERSADTTSGSPSEVTNSFRPSDCARDWKRPATVSRTSATSTGSRRSGTRPCSARARSSRSSAIRERRSVSSAALRIAASSSSVVRDRLSASSSSVLISASGVLSSWLASATKRRSRARPSPMRLSISFKRLSEPRHLVTARRGRAVGRQVTRQRWRRHAAASLRSDVGCARESVAGE